MIHVGASSIDTSGVRAAFVFATCFLAVLSFGFLPHPHPQPTANIP